MKKTVFFPICILIICFLFLTPLFHRGIHQTHDGENHLSRFAAYYKAFKQLQIPPQWAGDLNYRYGTPVFLFFYPLPGYIGSFIHALGFDFQTSFKIVSAFSFIGVPFAFYLWTSTFLKRENAWFSSLLYGLAPYHFLDLYVRGDIGESISFVCIPLIFWTIEKNRINPTSSTVGLGSIFFALFILSHNILSLIFFPVIMAYLILRSSFQRNSLIANLFMIFLGFCISSYFWLPALYESKYINHKIFTGNFYLQNFPDFSQLIYSSWGFGSDISKKNSLSPQIGLVNIVCVIGGIFIFNKIKNNKKQFIFWLIVFLLSLYMSTKYSIIIWNKSTLLQQFQFPWRFVALSSFSAAVLGGIFFSTMKKFLKIMLLLALIITSVPFTKVQGYISHADQYYLSFPGSTFYHGEATTLWTAGNASHYPKSMYEIIEGQGIIHTIQQKYNLHIFSVNAKTDMKIVDNTTYFPGWQVLVDLKKASIEFQDPNHRGLITFLVPSGKHIIQVRFRQTKIHIIGKILSLLGIVIALGLFFTQKALVKNT